MRRLLVIATLALAACGSASALSSGGGGHGGGDCKTPIHGFGYGGDGSTTMPDYGHPTYPDTTKPEHTTTTYKQHDTTTTSKPEHTTTTKPAETTTTKPEHVTTTTECVEETTTTKPGGGGTTTTTRPGGGTTTTTQPGGGGTTTTSPPTPGLFSVKAFAFCGPDFLPEISITFGNRPDLNGQVGVLSFSTGGSVFLTFQSNTTVTIAYPNTTQNVNLIYSLGPETATASVTYPGDCSTTTTGGGGSTTTTSTTAPPLPTTTTSSLPPTATTTTTQPPSTTTTLPPTFSFNGATTVCRSEVPTIVIDFASPGFPSLAGRVGTLTMSDVNGNVVSTQPLVYQPGGHVELLYPGTVVNPDGSIADVPGWTLQSNGLWVRDPSDEFLREGILLTYTVNPTATAFVTYPPESSACANPENPPGTPGTPGTPPTPGKPGRPLPPTL